MRKKVTPVKITFKETMPLDFTLTKFRALCAAVAENYHTLTLAEYFEGAALPPRFAQLRHDIDRKPGNALIRRGWSKSSG